MKFFSGTTKYGPYPMALYGSSSARSVIFYMLALKMPGLVSGSVVWSRGVWWERTGWTIEGRQDSAAAKDGAAPLWPWPVDQSEHFLDHTFISSAGALFLKYNVDSLAVCMWMVSATLPFSQCPLEHPQCMQPVVMLKSGHIIHASLKKFGPKYCSILHLTMNWDISHKCSFSILPSSPLSSLASGTQSCH